MKRLIIGRVYEVTKDFSTFAKEGHEPQGSQALPLAKGNTFKVLAFRDHGWYEAEVLQRLRFTHDSGGQGFSWRGEILVSQLQKSKYKLVNEKVKV